LISEDNVLKIGSLCVASVGCNDHSVIIIRVKIFLSAPKPKNMLTTSSGGVGSGNTKNASFMFDGGEPEPCCRLFTIIISLIFLGAMIVGAALCSWAFFRRHTFDFETIRHTDLQISQSIYGESVARQVKDQTLTVQNAQLAAKLPPEAAIREANFIILYYGILNETATRINEHMTLMMRLANETADRIAGDEALNAQLPNITMMVVMAEQYNVISANKFMIIMAQIVQLDTDLTNEINTRITQDAQKVAQALLADQTINYVNVTLQKEAHDRAIKDELLMEQLNAQLALGHGLLSINGQLPTPDHHFLISSSNPLTTIYPGGMTKSGRLVFQNNGIASINGVQRNATTGNIDLIPGTKMYMEYPAPHSLLVGTTINPTAANKVYLRGTNNQTYITEDVTPLFGACTDFNVSIPVTCGPVAKKIWRPVLPTLCSLRGFPSFNGNTCGWTAPANGTYIVEIVATLSVTLNFPYGNWLSTFALAIQDNTAPSNYICDVVHPETDGCMTPRDTVTVGGPRFLYTKPGFSVNLVPSGLWPQSNIDVVLKTTEIVNTPGGDTSGCFDGDVASCSYGFNPMYTTDIQGVFVRATTLEYFVTQIQM